MIVGNGLIATLFRDCDRADAIFFASGVSNSLEVDPAQFLREENLVRKTLEENLEKIFIYFSTCSVYDSSKMASQYVLHKLKMEQIIQSSAKKFLILRVSNAVGNGGNPNLLMNYLVRSVKNGETINVHTKATRNLIDAEDIKNITLKILEGKSLNRIVNLAYIQNYSVIEILEIIEKYFRIQLNINLIKEGSGYDIDVPDVIPYFSEAKLLDKNAYLENILKSYYAR